MKISDKKIKELANEVLGMLNEGDAQYDCDRCQDANDHAAEVIEAHIGKLNLGEEDAEELSELLQEKITFVSEYFKLD